MNTFIFTQICTEKNPKSDVSNDMAMQLRKSLR